MPHAPILPGLIPPMTPALYVRLRREAAGLTIAQAARAFYAREEHREACERNLAALELPGAVTRADYLVDDIRRAFPIDPAVYRQLRDEPPDRHPTICRGCGCNAWWPCLDRAGNECTIGEGLTCTACDEKAHRQATRRVA